MDAYLIRIDHNQFKSAISKIHSNPEFISSLHAANPELTEKQINKLSFTQTFVVKELGFDQSFPQTNQRWISDKTPKYAFISLPSISPSRFDSSAYKILKNTLVQESENFQKITVLPSSNFVEKDRYGTLNFIRTKFKDGLTYEINVDLKELGFNYSGFEKGLAVFSSDFILDAHQNEDMETMSILAEHYSIQMPQLHTNNISESFDRLATMAFLPQEKCHINFIYNLFMELQNKQLKSLREKSNFEKLPELNGTPKQILFAKNLRIKRIHKLGIQDLLVKTITSAIEWIELKEKGILLH